MRDSFDPSPAPKGLLVSPPPGTPRPVEVVAFLSGLLVLPIVKDINNPECFLHAGSWIGAEGFVADGEATSAVGVPLNRTGDVHRTSSRTVGRVVDEKPLRGGGDCPEDQRACNQEKAGLVHGQSGQQKNNADLKCNADFRNFARQPTTGTFILRQHDSRVCEIEAF